jgi:diguanylate cyclase (GGDEF)-like protein
MTTIAGEIVRAVQVERVFAEMDRDKFQKERFYEASREFNQALNTREVAQAAIVAARRVAQVDFAAVAVSLEEENRMLLTAVDWVGHDEVASWAGRELEAEHGLVGAAIKAHHALPHGTSRAQSQSVFGPGLELTLPGVKVVPLIARGRGVGALVVASSQEDFLPLGTLDMLEVIADHAAIALANAQLYEHNERLATTDGLTGLVNHRHFQRVFDQMLAQAERYGRKLSVILTDIDHFKSVNDTYGHPVGDKVLKRVAALISQTARVKIDVVARYGGEEFAVLLPETDRVGALRLAERIRTAVDAEQFYCENGRFKSSLSLGVATFPDDAATKAKLIDAADQSLYAAKREGRNRSITFDMLKSRREVSHIT